MTAIEKIYAQSPVFLQNIILNAKAAELYFERYGQKFRKTQKVFSQNQWLTRDQNERQQDRMLQRIIKHAYRTVPYYYHAMMSLKLKPDDIKTRDDLVKLPILTKEIIKNNFKALISKKQRKSTLRHGHTSGTTGTPLDIVYDINTCVVHHVADWRQKNWAGLEMGAPYASLQGRVIVPINQKGPPFWRKNYINNQLFLSSFHLHQDNIPFYLHKLKKDRIKVLEGYPSNIYILAMYLNHRNLNFPLESVLTSSETLFDFQKDAIEKAFCCKIFDFYGMAERTVFATECELHSGHHLNLDYGITEFLDDDHQPVEVGCTGRIVATSLHNYAMPLIRYQTNDCCAMKPEACGCGRGFPLMDSVTTKQESIVTLPDGRLISPSVLTHPFKPMHNIVESQILQDRKDRLHIKIVKNEKYSDADEKQLVAAFNERLGSQVNISVEYVYSIPRTASGKFRWVISEISPVI